MPLPTHAPTPEAAPRSACMLSVLITTYNRADYLNILLEHLYQYQQKGLSFAIVVSDDCSTDHTEEVAARWNALLADFTFVRAERNGGMDDNFCRAYQHAQTPYCWLLGDSRIVSEDTLRQILRLLSEGTYDALVLNCHDTGKESSQQYTQISTLISEIGWQLTNNAATIVPTDFARNPSLYRYIGTTFYHMGVFVENLCMRSHFKVLYCGHLHVYDIKVGSEVKPGWWVHPFLNFGKLWFTFVMSLPCNISIENKRRLLLSHHLHTQIFSLQRILGYKARFGQAFLDDYRRHRFYVPFVTDTPRLCIDTALMLVPRFLLSALYKYHSKRQQRS